MSLATQRSSSGLDAAPNDSHGVLLDFADGFVRRHLGSSEAAINEMLAALGFDSLETLSDATVPDSIR
ncbi:MAG: hypothetical protein AAGG48_13820, partial [Planctomycetota bacterium]